MEAKAELRFVAVGIGELGAERGRIGARSRVVSIAGPQVTWLLTAYWPPNR